MSWSGSNSHSGSQALPASSCFDQAPRFPHSASPSCSPALRSPGSCATLVLVCSLVLDCLFLPSLFLIYKLRIIIYYYYYFSAENGYTSAQDSLAECFTEGYGVVKNLETAFGYLKAAHGISDNEKYAVAMCYLHGRGTQRSLGFVKLESLRQRCGFGKQH
ncbi:hypothetical protein HK096_003652, partial [Nowakowskiella sp. JEL0078]